MGKLKSVVMEAQELACENYNLDRRDFRLIIEKEFADHPYRSLMIQAAYQCYDEIQNEMYAWHEGALQGVA